MLTLPQNGRNIVSKDLKLKNFPGEDTSDPPTGAAHFVKPPLLKTWICARCWPNFRSIQAVG